jgi:NAD(P)-dependent dehydrogenase (short-subunit alcohol dehydrogenase family)
MSGPAEDLALAGQVAIVTGGGTGIGAMTVQVLAENGANVVLASRRIENLRRAAVEVSAATGRRCVPVVTDVRNEQQVIEMARRTIEELGRIDILVNNAGGAGAAPILKTTSAEWDKAMALNLRGPFLCMREVGRVMVSQGSGAIVNISSNAGLYGVRGNAAYSAAKAGLQNFTRVAAAEWGPSGVRVNTIAVGVVETERAVALWRRAGMNPAVAARRIPLRRLGLPVDVAQTVLYLCSKRSAYITGQSIAVDGGPQIAGPAED